jgi:hypothetical protein
MTRYVLRRDTGSRIVPRRVGEKLWATGATFNPFMVQQGYFDSGPYADDRTFRLDLDTLLDQAKEVWLLIYTRRPEFIRDFGKVKTAPSGWHTTFVEMEVRFLFEEPTIIQGDLCEEESARLEAVNWAGLHALSYPLAQEKATVEQQCEEHCTNGQSTSKWSSWNEITSDPDERSADSVEQDEWLSLHEILKSYADDGPVPAYAERLVSLVKQYDQQVLHLAGLLAAG